MSELKNQNAFHQRVLACVRETESENELERKRARHTDILSMSVCTCNWVTDWTESQTPSNLMSKLKNYNVIHQ